MKKTDFNDGICNTCGNVGLAGDKCIVCGDVFSKVDEGLVDPVVHGDDDTMDMKEDPDVYPLEMLDEEEKGDSSVDMNDDEN